jgi:uncharacterized protein YjbI with pentapeptide repeats
MNAEDILNQYAAGQRHFPTIKLTEATLSGVNLSYADFSGASLSVANLSSSNFSHANLQQAQLNVSRLSGTNLSHANLREANLNVANLVLATLEGADLSYASLVRAELERADLSHATLVGVNFSGADLKNAKLRNADLTYANLSRADMRWAVLSAANLMHANLHGVDLSSADLSSADLSNTELRQANLSRANLRGANLSGANLRWADLNGANLSGADLSGAKLSGAALSGVNLSNANLTGTSLVHTDLSRANLIDADWSGADLSGATLTGSKLHGVCRFGIKTDGLICDWVDLSPNGDQSNVRRFGSGFKDFFQESPPTVRLVVDTALDHDAHSNVALTYRQICQYYGLSLPLPNLHIGRRRTTLTFEAMNDAQLFLVAFVSVLPFKDAIASHQALRSLLALLTPEQIDHNFGATFPEVNVMLQEILIQINRIKLSEATLRSLNKLKFLQAPTRTTLVNSKGQTLLLYSHPFFGKQAIAPLPDDANAPRLPVKIPTLSSFSSLVSFLRGFYFGEE